MNGLQRLSAMKICLGKKRGFIAILDHSLNPKDSKIQALSQFSNKITLSFEVLTNESTNV